MTDELKKKGFRTRVSSFYRKGKNEPFKISRSKFNNFLDCKRCFYLDRVKGLKEPGMPGWALNSAVDELLKKEFDVHRKNKTSHPIMKKYKLNFVPFQHKDIDIWREARSGGISYLDQNANLIIHGGVDDIWLNNDTEELVVVDYKSQSTNEPVKTESYLTNKYHQGYKIQMDIYVHILRNMDFKVSDTTYFMVCNGEKSFDKFDNKINFTTTLVPYKANSKWIPAKIKEMKEVLDQEKIPEINSDCEKCIYLNTNKYYIDD